MMVGDLYLVRIKTEQILYRSHANNIIRNWKQSLIYGVRHLEKFSFC